MQDKCMADRNDENGGMEQPKACGWSFVQRALLLMKLLELLFEHGHGCESWLNGSCARNQKLIFFMMSSDHSSNLGPKVLSMSSVFHANK